jgi:hypothetical protein
LVKQGTSALTDYINKNKKPGDTTKSFSRCSHNEEEVKAKATDLLNGLFKRKERSCRLTKVN